MRYLSLLLCLVFFTAQARMIAPAKQKCFQLKTNASEATISIKYYQGKTIMGDITVVGGDFNTAGDESMGFNAQQQSKSTLLVKWNNPAPKFESGMKWSKTTRFTIVKNKAGKETLQVTILKYSAKTKKYRSVVRTFTECPKE